MDDTALEFSDESPDPAIARAERRLRRLERLTEIGMALAEALIEPTMASEGGTSSEATGDPADAYSRISRAVRLTIALEDKIDRQTRDLAAGLAQARREKREKAAEDARESARKASDERKIEAYRLVLDVADSESEDHEDFEGLAEALDERLEEDEAYANCGERPLRETVERLCADLGLNPDWSHWIGEGWDETYSCNPFSRPSRRPLLWAVEPSGAAKAASGDGAHIPRHPE